MSATIEGRARGAAEGARTSATWRRCARTARCTARRCGSTCRTGVPVLNTAEGRAWPRNLERDPRVTLTVQNMENPYEYVEIRGRVAERTHEGADEHIDSLAKKYMDADELPAAPARRTARDHPRGARAREGLRQLSDAQRCPRASRARRSGAPQQPPPQRRRARLRAQPLVAQHAAARRARAASTHVGVRVAAAAGVAFGRDQHMLAERGQMMTTQRTAIRRRLAIRRTAHRPPWGARKPGHGSIVAPLAATLAATVASGVGVALARAERERRAAGERRARSRRFALLAGERVGEGLRRMALGQLDLAIEALDGRDGGTLGASGACTRRARRSSACARCCGCSSDELGEQALRARERGRARRRQAPGAGARRGGDAGHARRAGRAPAEASSGAGAACSACARGWRTSATARPSWRSRESAARARALDELRAMRARVAAWELAEPGGIEAIEPALRASVRARDGGACDARGARERARGRKLHEWRKRVKDLRYAAEMLQRRDEPARKRLRERAGGKSAKRAAQAREGNAAFIARAGRARRRARRTARRGARPGGAGAARAQRSEGDARVGRAGPGHAQGAAEGDRAAAQAPAQARAARRASACTRASRRRFVRRVRAARDAARRSADAEDRSARACLWAARPTSCRPARDRAARRRPAIRPTACPRRARRRAS